MNNKELKPCPFCGSEAWVYSYEWHRGTGGYSVLCKNPDCPLDLGGGYTEDGYPEGKYKTKADAIEAWNNRVQGSIYDMFPRIYWTKRNPMQTLKDKIDKLEEEAAEVAEAKDYMDIVDETLDVMHCCVEILRDVPKELVDESLLLHNYKNRERGYYEHKEQI